ncbi:flagellin [Mesorhizobium sp. RP14(2022)]|uniref:Flagellin n=1 Tax=Mesorhizobium liriopis TaxID=2953882 RepID=A0ABT1C865_9HYPH|nr:flagellin [Mesorhizobium liriopis]
MPSSILTNASALRALQTLNSTNASLESVQKRISTGLRVGEAADNAAYWSIATTMNSDKAALSVVQDSLGLGASKVDTAYTAMNGAFERAKEIRLKLIAAVGTSDDNKAKIQTEIKTLQDQIKSFAESATFSGTNWLAVNSTVASGNPSAGTHADAQVVSSFSRLANGSVDLSTIDINVQNIKLFDAAATTNETKGIVEGLRLATGVDAGKRDDTAVATVAGTTTATSGYSIMTMTVVSFNDDQIKDMINVADKTIADMADASTVLGAAKTQIDLQKSFTTSLMDSIERGVSQLVDADMNKESTRLQALQVQQQLGIQALSIANGNAQSILSLFKG